MTLQNAPRRGALQEVPEPEAAVDAQREDPITMDETAPSSSAIPDDATHHMDFSIPRNSTDLPTPEGVLNWLIHRCCRRLENSNVDLSRRNTGTHTWNALQFFEAFKEIWRTHFSEHQQCAIWQKWQTSVMMKIHRTIEATSQPPWVMRRELTTSS